jgi:Ca2+/Na+ antiporter
MFYLIVEEGTFIDWWIITRETVFILIYLTLISIFLYGNKVEMWSAAVLFVLYIVHIFLMKYSNKYEVALKKALANFMELTELTKIARKRGEIWRYHQSCKSKAVCIEMLNKIRFKLIDGYIVYEDTGIRCKLDPIICVKLGEEQFAETDDKALMSRLNFKRAVTKIIIKMQAYKFN